jgi:hypothetical protein
MIRILIPALLISGCALKEYESSEATAEFTGGTFIMTSQGVEDGCADSAFETLLMPDGVDTPTEWEHPISIPPWSEMATRVPLTIQLQDPFSDMDAFVVQGDEPDIIEMTGGDQQSVDFIDNNNLTGDATLVFADSTGMNCNFEPGCEMRLDFTAARKP